MIEATSTRISLQDVWLCAAVDHAYLLTPCRTYQSHWLSDLVSIGLMSLFCSALPCLIPDHTFNPDGLHSRIPALLPRWPTSCPVVYVVEFHHFMVQNHYTDGDIAEN